MISLKKNDKIIIIVAIVILVIAGIGVAMYQSPKTTSILPSGMLGEKSYDVIWTVRNGSLSTISEFAHKNSKYEGAVMIPHGNVKSVTFNLSWTDDHMTLLRRRGLDSLTLEVTTPDGITSQQTNTSARLTGKGTITLMVNTGIIPPQTAVKADTEKDAQEKLKIPPYYDDSWTDKQILIGVSVQIGEIRLLKKMRDKGNDFELKITYEYYDGVLKEDTTKNTGGDNVQPPDQDRWTAWQPPPYISMIISTGCGRYV
jgi:hypothetical protein